MRRCDVYQRSITAYAYERCKMKGGVAVPITKGDWVLLIWLCKAHHERSMEEVKA